MGIHMSFLRKWGVPEKQLHSSDEIFDQFFGPNICTFEEFHIAFLNFFTKFNATLPGRHYNAPPLESLKEIYQEWEDSSLDEKKYLLIQFLERRIDIIQTDNNTILWTGLVAPPAAMLLKKAVPDFIFVPFCTLLAVAAAKAMQSQMNKIV